MAYETAFNEVMDIVNTETNFKEVFDNGHALFCWLIVRFRARNRENDWTFLGGVVENVLLFQQISRTFMVRKWIEGQKLS